MIVTVTPEDITRGRRLSACSCPIALAIRRLAPRCVVVTNHTIRIDDRRFATPEPACKFINDFDAARPVMPFTFTLPTE
ncbi:MAG: hypothetical protein ACK5U7_15110 [Bacteroidota bacterium]|jgi:hypothetical protein